MNEHMQDYDYQNMISQGKICELIDLIREAPELLTHERTFSRFDAVFIKLWSEQPAMARKLLLELLNGEKGEDIARMLEALSVPFSFQWNECKCDVNGNALFRMVWDGEYEVVSALLDRGIHPDGMTRSTYFVKQGRHVVPYSRWGKIKCRTNGDDFFLFNRWDDPWNLFERDNDAHIITPLYLAELQGDDRMIHLLKDAGAHPMPSREKMWEDAKAPKNSGSVFGNL